MESKDDLKVIGVEHWHIDFSVILDRYKTDPIFIPFFEKIPDIDVFINSVRQNGPYASVIANVSAYDKRFISLNFFHLKFYMNYQT